ncbi:MAG: hypothetical protein OJF49_001231 [Ktedonobacterales bacterium]|jgi:NifU-like protein involved in Fe-S cluster formation|nr:MAG: hypothetical protein OJF49_001231 [Ktedonobacterales bacterium]
MTTRVKSSSWQKPAAALVGLCAVLALLAGCGSAATSSSAYSPQFSNKSLSGAPAATPANGSAASQGTGTAQYKGPSYLIKSLQVNLQVKDTQATASALLAWITATDPQSTTTGQDYSQVGTGLYTITLQFAVQATLYPQIEQYLVSYPQQHGGKLLNLHENVQDVTNDYIDTQARLTNLRAEQQRLLTLMSKASALSDVLALDQQLTNVEGQIEDIEAHQQALASQTTFYTITLMLQPAELPVTPAQPSGFHPGQTLHDALTAALAFAGWLASVLIWLVVFSVFVLPVVVVVLLVRRWRRRHAAGRVAPSTAS